MSCVVAESPAETLEKIAAEARAYGVCAVRLPLRSPASPVVFSSSLLNSQGRLNGRELGISNFVPFGRDQAFLLRPDLKALLPEDDLAHFVVAAVERVPLQAFRAADRLGGRPQYHPRLILALLIYCYADGIFSLRRMERASYFPRQQQNLQERLFEGRQPLVEGGCIGSPLPDRPVRSRFAHRPDEVIAPMSRLGWISLAHIRRRRGRIVRDNRSCKWKQWCAIGRGAHAAMQSMQG